MQALAMTALFVIALGLAIWLLRAPLSVGDVDPLSAVIGLLSLVVSVLSLILAIRAWRTQEVSSPDLADRLAKAVRQAEERAWRQLLGNQNRSINLRFDLKPAPAYDAVAAPKKGSLAELANYYQSLKPSRMVITGAAGSGKTVLATNLVLALLEARTPDQPVPVRFPATTWGGARIDDWLVDQICDAYGLSPRAAEAMVDSGRILPIIDGLDELDDTDSPRYASRAARLVRELNIYQRYTAKAAVVVTCRTGHYESLVAHRTWLEDSARIEIRSVSPQSARSYVGSRVNDAARWEAVLAGLRRVGGDPRLKEALSTPWCLTLATVAYEECNDDGTPLRDPNALVDQDFDSADAIKAHLLGLFIPAALRSEDMRGYRPDRVVRWLQTLAKHLDRNGRAEGSIFENPRAARNLSGADIVLHLLWPLAGSNRPRLICLGFLVIGWVGTVAAVFLHHVGESFGDRLYAVAPPFFLIPSFATRVWLVLWERPRLIRLGRVVNMKSRRKFMAELRSLWKTLFVAQAAMFLFSLVVGALAGSDFSLVLALAAFITIVITPAVFSIFSIFMALSDEAQIGLQNPRSIIRGNAAFGVVVGLIFGLTFASVISPATGIFFGSAVGVTAAPPAARYFSMLLCTRQWSRRWLPWRLGHFLDACCGAGIMRFSGSGYQFRHRDLQEFLAKQPIG